MSIVVNEQTIQDWKTKYSKVYKLAAEDQGTELEVYIKKPTRQIFNRFQDAIGAKKSIGDASRQLIFDVLLAPDKDELIKIFEEKPGLVTALGNKVSDIVGLSANFTVTEL